MEQMVAPCGLDCWPCEARIATQADDDLEKQRVATKWREAFGGPDIDVDYVTCDGCRSGSALICGWARVCPVRICAIARNVPTCAHCFRYNVCDTLAEFEKNAPGAKDRLAKIRAGLKPSQRRMGRRRVPQVG